MTTATTTPLTETSSLWLYRRRLLLGAVFTLIAVLAPFTELILGSRSGMYNDITGTHMPRYIAAWGNLRSGDSPFWWSSIFSGHNSLGAGQSAIFYPPTAIFAMIDPIPALRVWLIVHLWMMAGGWYLWAWRRWGSVVAAVVTGIIGTLNGTLVSHFIDLPYIACLALLPWALLVYDLLVEQRHIQYVAYFALIIAAMALNGLPQVLWIILTAFAVYSLAYAVARLIPWRELLRHGLAVALGGALSAISLIPQSRFSESSLRPKLSKQGAFEFSEEPRHFLTLIAPNIMGGANGSLWWKTPWQAGNQQPEQINYLGVVALALAVIGAVRCWRDRRVWALVAAAMIGVLVALGGSTPFGTLFYHVMPFADRFRIWSRHLLLLNVAVTCLVGAGIREILRWPRRWFTPVVIGTAALSVVLGTLPALTDLGGALVRGTEGWVARMLPIIFLLGLAAAVAVLAFRRPIGIFLLVAVLLVDMGSFAFAGLWRSQGATRSEADEIWGGEAPIFGQPADMPGGLDRWVSDVADSSTLWPSALPGAGPTVNGYDPLIQRDYAATLGYMSWTGYLNQSTFWSGGWLPDILRTTTLLASPYAGTPAPSWIAYATFGDSVLYNYTPRLAESYLVGLAQPGTLDDARNGINKPETPLTEFAYIDTSTIEDITPFSNLTSPGLSGTVSSGAMDGGGHGRWTVTADRPSLFVTSYAWMDGWTATVDGKRVPVARTNALVLGVPVPAGQHEVRLAFTPPGWTTGRNISIIAFVVVVLMLVGTTPPGRRVVDDVRRRLRRTPATATS